MAYTRYSIYAVVRKNGNYFNYIRQVNGVKLADILFSLLCACVSVSTQSHWFEWAEWHIVRREMYSTRVWKFDTFSVWTRYCWKHRFIGFWRYSQVQDRSGGFGEKYRNVSVISCKMDFPHMPQHAVQRWHYRYLLDTTPQRDHSLVNMHQSVWLLPWPTWRIYAISERLLVFCCFRAFAYTALTEVWTVFFLYNILHNILLFYWSFKYILLTELGLYRVVQKVAHFWYLSFLPYQMHYNCNFDLLTYYCH